ncbi:hypothetical protein C823_004794 [Eubacterium plexicaudatum ASF492]|uniref:Uncharacterized protein n=1 Tax=Eubacterium plexicaudatum ASF492 TaxID=1235802 RepID=N2A720_9FIRM|nr:hypothetical protein C823_004794 [Eubacterium plexicaudatum ASF492]
MNKNGAKTELADELMLQESDRNEREDTAREPQPEREWDPEAEARRIQERVEVLRKTIKDMTGKS